MHLIPKSSADRVIGIVADAQGGVVLKAAVTAAPENGRANAALMRLLARHFGLAPRDLTLVTGQSHRRKVIEFAGDPILLAAQLAPKLTMDPA